MGRNSKFFMLGMVVIISLLIASCDPSKKYEREEQESIDRYVREHGITVNPTSTGLYYVETLEGTGSIPQINDTVSVYYKGKFLNGNVFDSTLTAPIKFAMGSGLVIQGFEEGISYMKVGGKATLLLPSSLAYGVFGRYDYYLRIPGYTPLVFEVELDEIIPGAVK